MNDQAERAAFESAAFNHYLTGVTEYKARFKKPRTFMPDMTFKSFTSKLADGSYALAGLDVAWLAWQWRAKLFDPAPTQPIQDAPPGLAIRVHTPGTYFPLLGDPALFVNE